MKTVAEIQEYALEVLMRTYTQSADERQKAMGLSYTLVETHDLARFMAVFAVTVLNMNIDERANLLIDDAIERQKEPT